MGDEVEVKKLSVKEVLKIQKIVDKSQKSKTEESQLKLLQDVIKVAVVGAEEISEEDFNQFPLGELNKLTESILQLSGLGQDSTVGK
jgi:hypothetical protein